MRNKPIIKAISIDYDDTLWPIWPAIDRAEQKLHEWLITHAPRTGQAMNPERLRAIRNEVEQQHPDQQHDLSFYRRESIRLALKAHGEAESLADEAFRVFFAHRQKVDLYHDVIPALEQLSSIYPIIGITNGNANLDVIGLSQYISKSVSAQHLGVKKPDRAIYQTAQQLLGISNPAEILHVGDDYATDIIGAYQAGFQTAWIRRPELNIQPAPVPNDPRVDLHVQDLQELCQKISAV